MATTIEHASRGVEISSRSPVRHWRAWLILIALAMLYVPLLIQHGVQLWIRPHYQFFPLAILGALWLAYVRTSNLGPLEIGNSTKTLLAFVVCLLMLSAAVVLNSSWLAAFSFPPMLATLAYGAGGMKLLRAAFPALLLLCIVVPPPLELDRVLILTLQRQTTAWSSSFLDLFGIYHLMAGNVVVVGGQELFVDEACSGINSLFVIIACTLFVIFHEKRPILWGTLLLAFSIGWVLLANVARVLIMTVLKARHGVDLTTGWKHDALGFLMFGLALVMIWSTDRLLNFLFSPPEDTFPEAKLDASSTDASSHEPECLPTNFPSLGKSPVFSTLTVLPILALAALQFESMTVEAATTTGVPAPSESLKDLARETMPGEWGRWKQQDFHTKTRNPGSYFGEVSKYWTYQLGKNEAVFSIDYPFPAWHDLTRCYTGQGWAISGQAVYPASEKMDGFVEVALSQPGNREGYLLFSQYNGAGEPLRPRPGGPGLSLFRHGTRLERWKSRLTGSTLPVDSEAPPVYQTQLFIQTFTPLTAPEREEALNFFQLGLSKVKKFLVRPSTELAGGNEQ